MTDTSLKALQQDGRKKNYALAKETGLAPSTMLDRVKKLEEKFLTLMNKNREKNGEKTS